jgi:hypothetical protein
MARTGTPVPFNIIFGAFSVEVTAKAHVIFVMSDRL